jgi:hypothetical protein
MQATCQICKRRFRQNRGGRPRKACFECRPVRVRSEASPVAVVPDGVEPARGELEQATFAELAGRGRQETTAGVLALTIARSIDRGGHTGSQVAALAARLLDASAVAVKGAPKAADAVDELQAMRDRIKGA